jgi:hypothetical protein
VEERERASGEGAWWWEAAAAALVAGSGEEGEGETGVEAADVCGRFAAPRSGSFACLFSFSPLPVCPVGSQQASPS